MATKSDIEDVKRQLKDELRAEIGPLIEQVAELRIAHQRLEEYREERRIDEAEHRTKRDSDFRMLAAKIDLMSKVDALEASRAERIDKSIDGSYRRRVGWIALLITAIGSLASLIGAAINSRLQK